MVEDQPAPARGGPVDRPGTRRRWVVLAAGMMAMTAGCAFQLGLPYLIPTFRAEGMSLSQAATLAVCPTAGLLLTLIVWGAAADRWGERLVLSLGLGLSGLILLVATAAHGPVALGVCFVAAGAAGGSVHASSGRLILGWFAAHERGLAMGARQTAQPLGIAVAAVALPSLGGVGLWAALLFLGGSCLVAATVAAVAIRDPARPAAPSDVSAGSPYRGPLLWRIHAVSALLVVPQFAVATYALVFLVDSRGWHPATAGALLAAAQIGGAATRLAAGYWSDRIGSRLRPLRVLAMVIGLVVAALALGAAAGSTVATVALFAAAIVTVSANGLAFTAVAEYAGQAWAGRALGIQNTAQMAFAVITPPVLAVVIAAGGYGTAFAAVVAFPFVAAAIVPIAAERPVAPHPRADRAGHYQGTGPSPLT